jgi:hypothetical protein
LKEDLPDLQYDNEHVWLKSSYHVKDKKYISIKELSDNVAYTATLYVNGNSTNMNAVITDGSTQFSIVTNSNFQLNELDLISIKVEWQGGALSNGVTASLLCNVL